MAHKFDPKNISRLDAPDRKAILPPYELLKEIGLKLGDTFLDIGAGTGYFSIPATGLVGRKGKVIAVDSSPEMIAELNKRLSCCENTGVEVRQSDENDLKVDAATIDMAFMSVVLHEVEEKEQFIQAVKSVLKPGGNLAVIEWTQNLMEKGDCAEGVAGETGKTLVVAFPVLISSLLR